MLQSVVSKYERIMEILAAKGVSEKLNGYNNETANGVVTVLEPFKEASDVLEGEKYPTVQFIVLWLHKLESHCNTGPDDAEVLRVLKERSVRLIEEKVELQTLHRIATLMWPTFRQLKIMSVPERDETLNAVHQISDEISVAGIIKVPPSHQQLFNKDNQIMEDDKMLQDYGLTSSVAKAQSPAAVGLALRKELGDFEPLDITPFSSPPDLPDVMKSQESNGQEQTS